MGLISCPACQHSISDRAVACPQCGHPITHVQPVEVVSRGSGCGLLISSLIIVAIAFYILTVALPNQQSTRGAEYDSAPSSVPKSADAPTRWRELGRQGGFRFVLIDEDAKDDRSEYQRAFDSTCGTKRICSVKFWTDFKFAARSIPMTDAQVAAQVASFDHNSNTGLHRLMFACSPTVKTDCF